VHAWISDTEAKRRKQMKNESMLSVDDGIATHKHPGRRGPELITRSCSIYQLFLVLQYDMCVVRLSWSAVLR
jgi:hypothetical protein